jgi:hypothetical protein
LKLVLTMGRCASNTCFLADLGWRGIYVEPVPEYAERYAGRHGHNPNITVVSTAVGEDEGTTELHLAAFNPE